MNEPSKGGYGLAVRIVDGTFTPGEPTIVALRPGARDILDPALAGLWIRRGGGDFVNVYQALLDVLHMYSVFLSFDACLALIQRAKLASECITPSFYYNLSFDLPKHTKELIQLIDKLD
mgnify:CR=1 FL=1